MPQNDQFGGTAIDVDEFGGESLAGEDIAAGLNAQLAATGAVRRAITSPAAGEASADARAQTEAQRQLLQRQQFSSGGMPGIDVDPAVARYAVSIPGRVAVGAANTVTKLLSPSTYLPPEEQERLRPKTFGETPEDVAAQRQGPLRYGQPLYQPQTADPSDLQKIVMGASTPESLLTLPVGFTRTGAKVLLFSMVPGLADQAFEIVKGGGSEEDKRDRINSLIVPVLLGLRATKPAGMKLFPEVSPRLRSPKVTAPDDFTEGMRVPPPITLTGGELPGLPRGARAIRPVAGPEVLGPPVPKRGLPGVDMPATPAEPVTPVIREIRDRNARTTAEIKKLYPQLNNEAAADLRRQAWGGAPDTGVVVSPRIPLPSPMPEFTPRPRVEAPPPAAPTPEAARAAEEAQADAARISGLNQLIITQTRELDRAVASGDKIAERDASQKLMDLKRQRDAPPPPAKRPIVPKPPVPNVPRSAIKPAIPGTPAEPRDVYVARIRQAGAHTTKQVQALYPGISNEHAARVRDEAWPDEAAQRRAAEAKSKPPEEPPPTEPAGAPVPKPPPAPPAAPAPPVAAPAPVSPSDAALRARVATPQPPARVDARIAGTEPFQSTEDAWHTGLSLTSEAQVDALRQKTLQLYKDVFSGEGLSEERWGKMMAAQFFREAYEAATGTHSAGRALKARLADYKPPFPRTEPENLSDLAKRLSQEAPPSPPAPPTPVEVPPAAAAPVPPAPAAPEPEWMGRPLSAWEPLTDPANLPKGDERARLAKSLGVPNQPTKISQHIKRRLAEQRTKPVPAAPVPEPILPAPEPPAAAGTERPTPATAPATPAAPVAEPPPPAVPLAAPKPPEEPPPPISVGPGAASPAEFAERGPEPDVLDLKLGNPLLNKIQRGFTNFGKGISQLFTRGGEKQDMMQLANAADNLPRMAGQAAGNGLRVRSNEQEQVALTFVMQALKMSGDGLSTEAAARLGALDFAGDPIGYLRIRGRDMQNRAQRLRNEGQMIEAKAALDAAKGMAYARDNFNRLRPLAERTKAKYDLQHRRLAANGIDVNYENWYVPQRHELDLFTAGDRPIVLGHSKGSGTATGFKKAKVYEDYVTAIEHGFVPQSLNQADLLEHYVAQTERLIARKAFFEGLKNVNDPVDGKPIAMWIPRRVIVRPDASIDVQESIPLGYSKQEVIPGASIAIHDGYSRLARALTATSQLSESAAVGTLEDLAAIEKHIGLALDTFHASRTMQAELALTRRVSLGARQRAGRALVEYNPGDLDAAVSKGEITQEMADWIRTPRPMQVNGREINLNPRSVVMLGAKNGLNVGRFGDAMYRSWLRDIPITGTVNKWVFDKMTRSAIAQSFLVEFERVARERPDLTATRVARTVASDINVMFGNLQKESFFRNPSFRSISRILFLAPQWVEAMARREGRFAKQMARLPLDIYEGRPASLGTVGKGIGTGLAAYFLGTQLLNLATRQQFTFQNPEKGHKLDAWIPDLTGKTKGFFISPLSVFGEITHDLIRYAATKPDLATALSQIGANKLGNLGRFLEVVATGRDPMTGEKIVGTARRALNAAFQAVPMPISISQPLRAVGAKVAPGIIQPPAPGATQRQLTSSLGFKTEPVGSAQSQIYRMVDHWKENSPSPKLRAEVERRLKEDFGPSDYGPLRTALIRGDNKEARRAYQDLRNEGKTPRTIRQTLQHPHPFTGSAANEARFKASLSPDDRKLYQQAIDERRELWRRYQKMLAQPAQ